MDDSSRLRRRIIGAAEHDSALDDAARLRRRLPIEDAVAELARRHGVDPAKIRPATDEEMAAQETAIHRERLVRQSEILLRRLPERYRNATIPHARFGAEAASWLADYRAARAAGDTPRSLVILGPTGTGKTWTACAIARELLVTDTVPVTVVSVGELLDALRALIGDKSGLGVDMAQFCLAPVLVLDDLGTEILSEWAAEQLYKLAHNRSHNGRPLVVTSNLTGPQLRERYEQRTLERMFGGAQLIEIAGGTRRPMPF